MATRRDVIKGITVLGGLGVAAAGYRGVIRDAARGWWAGRKPAHPIYGDALVPEAAVERTSGAVEPSSRIRIAHAVCHGCTTLCGVRVVQDAQTGKVLRALGNPYHPLSASPALSYETAIRESYRAFTPAGHARRGVMCARGNAAFEKMSDPFRVKGVLKRAGPRGSGKWQTIPFEQAIREIAEGGRLFAAIGEQHHVPGLRHLRDVRTPLDARSPDLGPVANQLGVVGSFDDGRIELVRRFVQSFGTVNMWEHRGTCALTLRAGYSAFLDDWKAQPHLKPDFENCEFAVFFATSPGNAGNPFKRQAQLIAAARTDGRLRYAIVDPVQHNGDALAAGDRARWVGIRPGTDAALAMGMARWIFDHERYDARYLSLPSPAAAEASGEPSCSGATWLVVVEPGHPKQGALLRAADLEIGSPDELVVKDVASGELVPHTRSGFADPFFDGPALLAGKPVRVRTTLALYRESAHAHTIAEYAAACGVQETTLVDLARELTSHGKRAAVDAHGGTMHAGGFDAAWSAVALNGLIGNLNWKGGTSAGGGHFAAFGAGPRYDLETIDGGPKAHGVKLTRESDYRESSEFKRDGFPAKAPWHPFGRALQGEVLADAMDGYPYPLKALISFNANPLYGAAGLDGLVRDRIRDVERLPLFVAVDPFVNETTLHADYVFPDSAMYESWGVTTPWAGVVSRVSGTRYPVVDPPGPRTAAGDALDGDAFLISLALALGLPGFGPAAIPAPGGGSVPLLRPASYYLRAFANVAFDGTPVPDVSADDRALTGIQAVLDRYAGVLTPDEERKVAYVLARGGRFQDRAAAYQGEWLAKRYAKPVQFYQERLARTPDSQTGAATHPGVPRWEPPRGASGAGLQAAFGEQWPLLLVSHKSQTRSSMHPGTRVRSIRPRNFIDIGPDDAARLGLVHGRRARLETPGGAAEGIVRIRYGLQPGVVTVEHGLGHWAFGVEAREVDGHARPADARRGLGISLNRIAPLDPTMNGVLMADRVTGAAARNALPARVVAI